MNHDLVVIAATSTALTAALVDAGLLIGVETGFIAAPGVLYSNIGERENGYAALVSMDDEIVQNVQEIKDRLEALTDPSSPPLRVRAGVEVVDGPPSFVTMRQARLALLKAGKLAAVNAAIAALPEPSKSAALIEWEYSNAVQRHNGFVSVLAPYIGMTEADLDAIFILAASL